MPVLLMGQGSGDGVSSVGTAGRASSKEPVERRASGGAEIEMGWINRFDPSSPAT
jgi:hypothetical protein